jgi:hypothetical protein
MEKSGAGATVILISISLVITLSMVARTVIIPTLPRFAVSSALNES